MLIPLVTILWRASKADKGKDRVLKSDLLSYRTVDLELEAQYKDVRRQLNEYDRSREPEVRGRWNKVCGECGYVNHERHRFCESCGHDLVEETVEVLHICPKCRTSVPRHVRECPECGARFWSPIVLRRTPDKKLKGVDVSQDEGHR
jgi:YgiT-type zinc finger domain-containing protein